MRERAEATEPRLSVLWPALEDTLDRAPPQFVAYVLERATQSRVAPTRVLHGHAHQQADDRR